MNDQKKDFRDSYLEVIKIVRAAQRGRRERERTEPFADMWAFACFLVLLGIVCLYMIPGCQSYQERIEAETMHFKGTVSDVRVSSAAVTRGDPAGGALIGGLLAGPLGAAAGASGNARTTRSEIVACSFVVTAVLKEETIVRAFIGTQDSTVLRRCSLLRDGDTISLEKYQETVSWTEKKPEYFLAKLH